MSDTDFEELDIDEVVQRPMTKACNGSRSFKKTLETYSTNSNFSELEIFDIPKVFPSHKSKFSDFNLSSQSSKTCCRDFSKLPERLNSLKQITENKIKFLRLEKQIKELENCTFKPQTNTHQVHRSISFFTKQQVLYKKSKNSNMIKLNLLYSSKTIKNPSKPQHKGKPPNENPETVYDRLYKDSKTFFKPTKPKKTH